MEKTEDHSDISKNRTSFLKNPLLKGQGKNFSGRLLRDLQLELQEYLASAGHEEPKRIKEVHRNGTAGSVARSVL